MSLSPPSTQITLPNPNPNPNTKKRPSIVSTSAASVISNSSQQSKRQRMHPLRQTSFPISADTDPRVYGGASVKSEPDGGSVTGSFTGSFAESFDGVKGRKKKGKGKKGDGDGDGSGSVKGGKRKGDGSMKGGGGGSKAGAGADDEGEGDEDDEYMDDAEMLAGEGGGPAMDAKAEKENLAVLIDAFNSDQSTRYDLFKRAKLSKPALRKIVNQTLSQSVPPNVVTTVSGYSKIFIGEIIEKARTVQEEWANATDLAAIEAAQEAERKAAEEQANTAPTPAATPKTTPTPTTIKQEGSSGVTVKTEDPQPSITSTQSTVESTPPLQSPSTNINPPLSTTTTATISPPKDAEKPPFTLPPNPHRGPLLPAHIREALRRYKRSGEGGNVGFSGLSTKGLGVKGSSSWNVNGAGGRRLFR